MKQKKNVVLSGDDMICYLLFPEVLFHAIDKMEKARSWRCAKDSYGMDLDFSIYFFKPFSHSFYVFLAFLFLLCLCLRHNQSWWQSHKLWSVWEGESLKTVCLLPRALVGTPYRGREKASWEIQLKWPSRWRHLTLEDTSSVLKNVFHLPLLSVVG